MRAHRQPMSELRRKKLSVPIDWRLLVIYMEPLNTPCLLPLTRLKEVGVLAADTDLPLIQWWRTYCEHESVQ